MDHLSVWLRRKRIEGAKSKKPPTEVRGSEVQVVESMINKIPQELLAEASFRSQSHARSLLNFEQTVRSLRKSAPASSKLQGYYEKMHCIYACLDEPDGMEGISTLVVSPSLEHQIREHESIGRWTSAQSCWELQLQRQPNDPLLHKGLLNCLRNLGHYGTLLFRALARVLVLTVLIFLNPHADTMQTHIRGVLSQNPQWQPLLAPYEVEGAWILSQWEEVARLVDLPDGDSDKHALARLLLAMRTGDRESVETAVTQARRRFGQPILAAGKLSYRSMYDHVLQLQVIDDLEMIFRNQQTADLPVVLSRGVDQTLPSFRIREVLLNAHRSGVKSLERKSLSESVAAAWIQTSKFARRAGHLQTSYSAMLQAAQEGAKFAFIQRAKLLLSEDQLQPAIQVMNNSLAGYDFKDTKALDPSLTVAIAKASLLRSSIIEATGRYSRNEVTESYRKTAKINETAEKPWYLLGHHADISRDVSEGNSYVIDSKVVQYLLRALRFGTKFFFRTLPRILTIWLDGGENAKIVQASSGTHPVVDYTVEDAMPAFREICSLVRKAHVTLPGYQVRALLVTAPHLY